VLGTELEDEIDHAFSLIFSSRDHHRPGVRGAQRGQAGGGAVTAFVLAFVRPVADLRAARRD
jgi:hypothetical protein